MKKLRMVLGWCTFMIMAVHPQKRLQRTSSVEFRIIKTEVYSRTMYGTTAE